MRRNRSRRELIRLVEREPRSGERLAPHPVEVDARGVDVAGWDPHFAARNDKREADVIVSGGSWLRSPNIRSIVESGSGRNAFSGRERGHDAGPVDHEEASPGLP
jgi:hypothetical protein